MRKSLVVGFAGALAALVLVVTVSMAAAPKQYQFSGAVAAIDEKAKTVSVDRGGDVWVFSTTGLKGFKAKKGDKITIHYQMVAKKVEAK